MSWQIRHLITDLLRRNMNIQNKLQLCLAFPRVSSSSLPDVTVEHSTCTISPYFPYPSVPAPGRNFLMHILARHTRHTICDVGNGTLLIQLAKHFAFAGQYDGKPTVQSKPDHRFRCHSRLVSEAHVEEVIWTFSPGASWHSARNKFEIKEHASGFAKVSISYVASLGRSRGRVFLRQPFLRTWTSRKSGPLRQPQTENYLSFFPNFIKSIPLFFSSNLSKQDLLRRP